MPRRVEADRDQTHEQRQPDSGGRFGQLLTPRHRLWLSQPALGQHRFCQRAEGIPHV
jgi:hypothetical protein